MMLILVLLGMYFDAFVVFVTSPTLLFRLAQAIPRIVTTGPVTTTKIKTKKLPYQMKKLMPPERILLMMRKRTSLNLFQLRQHSYYHFL